MQNYFVEMFVHPEANINVGTYIAEILYTLFIFIVILTYMYMCWRWRTRANTFVLRELMRGPWIVFLLVPWGVCFHENIHYLLKIVVLASAWSSLMSYFIAQPPISDQFTYYNKGEIHDFWLKTKKPKTNYFETDVVINKQEPVDSAEKTYVNPSTLVQGFPSSRRSIKWYYARFFYYLLYNLLLVYALLTYDVLEMFKISMTTSLYTVNMPWFISTATMFEASVALCILLSVYMSARIANAMMLGVEVTYATFYHILWLFFLCICVLYYLPNTTGFYLLTQLYILTVVSIREYLFKSYSDKAAWVNSYLTRVVFGWGVVLLLIGIFTIYCDPSYSPVASTALALFIAVWVIYFGYLTNPNEFASIFYPRLWLGPLSLGLTVVIGKLMFDHSGLQAMVSDLMIVVAILFILGVLAAGYTVRGASKQIAITSVRLGAQVCALYMFLLVTQFTPSIGTTAGGAFWFSPVCVFFKAVFVFILGSVLHNSVPHLLRSKFVYAEFGIIMFITGVFMLQLTHLHNIFNMFVCIVSFSIGLYTLSLVDGIRAVSREAGLKYFLFSVISSVLIMYSVFGLLFLAHTTELNALCAALWTGFSDETLQKLVVIVILFVFGMLFKFSAVPAQLWAPDVYEGVSGPVTALLLLASKLSTFFMFLVVLSRGFECFYYVWQPILAASIVLSLLWGCFGALHERKFRRFLAYASINQVGFLMIGLLLNTLDGCGTFMLYLAAYIIASAGFLAAALISQRRRVGGDIIYLSDLQGLGSVNGLLATAMAVFAFTWAGIPPLAGFFGKFLLLLNSLQSGYYIIFAIGLIVSVVSAYYYLRIVKIVWFDRSTTSQIQVSLFPGRMRLIFWPMVFVIGLFAVFPGAMGALAVAARNIIWQFVPLDGIITVVVWDGDVIGPRSKFDGEL